MESIEKSRISKGAEINKNRKYNLCGWIIVCYEKI